jgi:hypothetical protein
MQPMAIPVIYPYAICGETPMIDIRKELQERIEALNGEKFPGKQTIE